MPEVAGANRPYAIAVSWRPDCDIQCKNAHVTGKPRDEDRGRGLIFIGTYASNAYVSGKGLYVVNDSGTDFFHETAFTVKPLMLIFGQMRLMPTV